MPGVLTYVTLGLALVLAWRKPARRMFGAGPAFTLWLLPPLLTMLPWLPTLPATWATTPTLLVLPATAAFGALSMSAASPLRWPLLLWLIGTLACLLRLTMHYERLLRQSHQLPADMLCVLQADLGDLDPRRLWLHPAGPAVLWAPQSRVLLPADFLDRFDADERRLVLQHESMHLRRGDALWSLLAELAAALLWFHPLAWFALPRLRLDQELACDERVLHQSPQDTARYARTLLHSTGQNTAPALIPWLAEPQLKERLSMIQHRRPGILRRQIGFVCLTAIMAGSVFFAQATTPPAPDQQATADVGYNTQFQPRYPADAVKNRQEGTVVLSVLVGTDGTPRKIEAERGSNAAPSLIAAASEAAAQWRFSPGTKGGKPVESHARVPVKFSLDPLPPAPPHASPNS
ncbi:M56 family peptidase [Rhodanobacter glycinis]|uniref:M56 family peptidase n=1 Tax=Rhodanobacter glycinis TaxID=582702 RepID=A0A502CBV2_9GAMM|nr:M56 family metallopeptidase [Rhodanobacter glycinis]TPG10617.1 M56 family peptidase [Rhodanobacter glycinis]